jgi:hypothetical protein
MRRTHYLTKADLIEAAYTITGGNLGDLSVGQIERLITITQHVTDLCLNELERRGELELTPDGTPLVPYVSEYLVECILTRNQT